MDKIIIYTKDSTRGGLLAKEWENAYQFQSILIDDPVQLLRQISLSTETLRGIIVLLTDLDVCEHLQGAKEKAPVPPVFYEPQGIDRFNEEVKGFFEYLKVKRKYQGANKDYIPVRFYDFMTFGIAPCDVYIRMGISNHVKIINKDDLYTREILDHYRSKKINELYIKKGDANSYLSDLYQNLKGQLNRDSSVSSKLTLSVAGIDFIHTSLTQIGVDEKAIEMAKETINSVLVTLALRPDLHKALKDHLSAGSFLTEHSIAIACVSCAIAKNLKLNNQFTTNKLVIAALFHDISLRDRALSLIVNTDSTEYGDLTDEKKREYSEHVFESVEFLRQIPDLPANVETIILEHHERPNGNGFPRGLDSFTITPLGCIFILAEEFVQHLFRNEFTPKNRDAVLERMSHEFSRGNFKAPMSSLLRLFI